jgi:hypothetical protein
MGGVTNALDTTPTAPAPTMAQGLAAFVVRASRDDLSPEARLALKARVLDAIERLEQIAVTDLTALLARVLSTEGADDDDGADL